MFTSEGRCGNVRRATEKNYSGSNPAADARVFNNLRGGCLARKNQMSDPGLVDGKATHCLAAIGHPRNKRLLDAEQIHRIGKGGMPEPYRYFA